MRQFPRKKSSAAPYLSILLPLYNEEDNIKLQYDEIVRAVDSLKVTYEILFVDDGSTDRSFEVLSSIASRDRRVKLIQFRRNFGQTAAMAAGINHSRGEILIFMDSDLQNDPRDIARLLEKIREGYDVVSGWRKNRKDNLFIRTIPSRIANRLISRVSGVRLHDLGCSLKAYRGEVLRQVKLYGEMHRFIPIHASWVGASITEIPVNHNPRRFGKSKYGIVRTFKVILDLFTVKFMGSFSTKPIYIFGGAAIILFSGSLLSGTAVILMKLLLGHSMIRNPLLLLTVMLIILGTMFILLGLLAEISIRTYHESQSMPPYRIKKTINIDQAALR
ncbi:MAG TPA: glycosyltransferase family 2 protein [Spirochaetota bacterium]|nr:glycosyltransferase family 2 protein [Spirochaetota bacterium]